MITDSNLVWDQSFENLTDKFSVKLSDGTIKELLDNKNNLEQDNLTLFPILKNEILKIKTILLNEHGFIIIDGIWCEIDTPQDLEIAKRIFK